ncbi:hypothetical protein ANOM_007954 [Aspergillus nomiae NRRL 13137]|uniref:Aminoglycoside phosphotransferase domain-containing protein n=1 Tax=Aspergillus nomiae NRRL (strain ATCC 15546 / NRRL 13137 / CBS 260.88 / M93) TaxID=1509407 RepID=A0A0L1ITX4_ASPN3|nr:uncharacterized protein ANOM_007954 [Aspergillus nomiae NRRL 13137]KNG82932.1 hypothetical protein ANOM_007954 [Aspergillus nomiae NRRL 13137]
MRSVDEVLKLLNKQALLEVASSLAGTPACQLDNNSSPITGPGYIIFIISFRDRHERWAARIPLNQDDSFLEICIRPIQLARKSPNVPAPRIHGHFDCGSCGYNPVGVGYMLLDWIEGSPMMPWDQSTPPVPYRQKVLDQITDLILNMILECPLDTETLFYGVPDGTPKGTQVSTSVWLTESVDRGIRRTLRRQDYSTAIDYLIQRSMIPRYVVAQHENCPWVFVHVDLHNDNIIIDEEYNIKGIIDWDCNFAVPLQKAATLPKLLENVPGAAPLSLPETHAYLDLAADKSYFLSILAEKERKRTNGTSITRLMETSSERNFFEMSHHRVPVHREFVSRFCPRTRENVLAALKEVERFLDINAMFKAGDEAIARTVQTLEALLY